MCNGRNKIRRKREVKDKYRVISRLFFINGISLGIIVFVEYF